MAKKSVFGKLVTLGGIAAAAAVAYTRREELKKLLNDAADRWIPQEEPGEEEPDVIIDVTGAVHIPGDACKETVEETPEN